MNTTTSTTTESAVTSAARVCAQGWAQATIKGMKRLWTAPVPLSDHNYLEREVLHRDATAEESAEFSRVFVAEFNACMAQKAEREGWDGDHDRTKPPPGFTVRAYNECWFYWTFEVNGEIDDESDSFARESDALADAWREFDSRA